MGAEEQLQRTIFAKLQRPHRHVLVLHFSITTSAENYRRAVLVRLQSKWRVRPTLGPCCLLLSRRDVAKSVPRACCLSTAHQPFSVAAEPVRGRITDRVRLIYSSPEVHQHFDDMSVPVLRSDVDRRHAVASGVVDGST